MSPLTRGVLKEFMATIGSDLARVVQLPIARAVEPFLEALQARRSPIPRADRESIRDTLDLLDPALRPHVAAIKTAMSERRPICITPVASPDATAAALIVEHTLDWYFGTPIAQFRHPGTFEIRLGAEAPPCAEGTGIGPWHTRTVSFGVAVRA